MVWNFVTEKCLIIKYVFMSMATLNRMVTDFLHLLYLYSNIYYITIIFTILFSFTIIFSRFIHVVAYVVVQSPNCVRLLATPWTAACQGF